MNEEGVLDKNSAFRSHFYSFSLMTLFQEIYFRPYEGLELRKKLTLCDEEVFLWNLK